jgi:RNA polymerase sigma factor (sigma-70 family)
MPIASASPVLHYIRDIVRRASSADVPDAQLLDQFIASRDEAAFAALVNRHGPMVLAVCRRKLGQIHDAEDAFQATFLVLARKAAKIGRPELVGNWLYGVACRTAAKARTNARKREARERLMANLPEPRIPDQSPDLRPILDEEVCRLPAKYRAPFVLCYLEGKSSEEAAQWLGCPKGTVHSRLAWARQRLRSRLIRRGVALSAALLTTRFTQETASASVPAVLAAQTVKAALLFAVGEAAAVGTVSIPVLILTRGVLQAMFVAKLTIPVVFLLALAVLSAGVGVLIHSRAEASPAGAVDEELVLSEGTAPDEDSAPPRTKETAKPKKSHAHVSVKDVVTQTFKTGTAPRLVVELFNGGIEVVAKGNRTVSARVTKQGSGDSDEAAREALKRVDVKMSQEEDTVRIVASQPEESHRIGSAGASAELEVPPGATLELHTSNGPVSINGGTGQVNTKTSNGPIQVTDNTGPLTLVTGNGTIKVIGGSGRMDLSTTNGKVEIRAERAVVKARTSNGTMSFQGSLADGAHTFSTSNGNIVLKLPSGTSFEVDADTTHGRITTDFRGADNNVQTKRRTHLRTKIGDNPAISLKAHTTNGNIELRESK